MKRMLPLLLLAACSTWTSHEMNVQSWDQVVVALRAAEGPAVLVSGDRGYFVRRGLLERELKTFTMALADAAEAQGMPRTGPKLGSWPNTDDEVVAFPHVTRALTMGSLSIKSIRTDSGTHYWASLERKEHDYAFVTLRGTVEVDQAWRRLARRVRQRAGPTTYGMTIATQDGFIRDVGVELRGIR